MILSTLILIWSFLHITASNPIINKNIVSAEGSTSAAEVRKRNLNNVVWAVNGHCTPDDDPPNPPTGFKLRYYQLPASKWDATQDKKFWRYYDNVNANPKKPKATPLFVQRGVQNTLGSLPSGINTKNKISVFEYTGYIYNWGYTTVDVWLDANSMEGTRSTAILGNGAFNCFTHEQSYTGFGGQLTEPHDDVTDFWSGTFDLKPWSYTQIRIIIVGKAYTGARLLLSTEGTGSGWMTNKAMKKWIVDPDALKLVKPTTTKYICDTTITASRRETDDAVVIISQPPTSTLTKFDFTDKFATNVGTDCVATVVRPPVGTTTSSSIGYSSTTTIINPTGEEIIIVPSTTPSTSSTTSSTSTSSTSTSSTTSSTSTSSTTSSTSTSSTTSSTSTSSTTSSNPQPNISPTSTTTKWSLDYSSTTTVDGDDGVETIIQGPVSTITIRLPEILETTYIQPDGIEIVLGPDGGGNVGFYLPTPTSNVGY